MRTYVLSLGMCGVGEEASEGVGGTLVSVVGWRARPELHCEVSFRHVNHLRVECIVVGKGEAPCRELLAILCITHC